MIKKELSKKLYKITFWFCILTVAFIIFINLIFSMLFHWHNAFNLFWKPSLLDIVVYLYIPWGLARGVFLEKCWIALLSTIGFPLYAILIIFTDYGSRLFPMINIFTIAQSIGALIIPITAIAIVYNEFQQRKLKKVQ